MRTVSLAVVPLVLAVASGCFGGSGSKDDTAVPDLGDPGELGQPKGEGDKARPELGRAALRGLVDQESGQTILATCEGERFLLLGPADRAYDVEGELPAMGAFEVMHVALGVADLAHGIDGGARVQGVLDLRGFEAGDCDLDEARPSPPRAAVGEVRVAEARKRALRLQTTLDASFDAPAPLTMNEAIVRDLVGATKAICASRSEVHRVFWEVEAAGGDFVGAWFIPCVIADRITRHAGLGPAEGTWVLKEDGKPDETLSGPLPAIDTAPRLLGYRADVGNLRVNCATDGRCPAGVDPASSFDADKVMHIPGQDR